MTNQARLRAHLSRLGWTYRDLSAWLTAEGEPVSARKIAGWMASPEAADYRRCPVWPSLLIERYDASPRQPK